MPTLSDPFIQSVCVEGVIVTVQADAGAFPEGAVLCAAAVPVYTDAYRAADAAVSDARDEDQNVVVSYIFDIKVIDPETGEDLQPADGFAVEVSFAMAEANDENLEASVYHMKEDAATGALTAEALYADVDAETVTAVSDGFSLYTVEFTYERLQYVLPGDESVSLKEILDVLRLSGRGCDRQRPRAVHGQRRDRRVDRAGVPAV